MKAIWKSIIFCSLPYALRSSMFNRKLFFALCSMLYALCLLSSVAWAATYYVDATNGNDGNNGLSESTTWKTIAKVNASSFNPGDRILFKRGEIWRETLAIPASGESGHPLIFGSYGNGDRPIISGANIITGWLQDSSMNNVWYAELSIAADPEVLHPDLYQPLVFFDGIKGTKVESKAELDSNYEWHGDDTTLYVFSTSNPDIAYINPGIEVPVRDKGIIIDDRPYDSRTHSYITIQDIYITSVRVWLIDGINSDRLTIENCVIEYASPGDANNDPVAISLNHNTTNALVEGCTIHDVGSGIYIGTAGGQGKEYAATGNIIRNNEIYNAHSGVNIKDLSFDNTIEANYIHDIITQGIRAGGSETEGNTVTRNFIENCSEDGIEVHNWAKVNYNIIKSCYNGIIVISRPNLGAYNINLGDNNTIYNNVIYNQVVGIAFHNVDGSIPESNRVSNNILSECSRAIRFADGTSPGGGSNLIDYNCYYHSTSLLFANPDPITYEEWLEAYRQDAHSIAANPLFVVQKPEKATDFYLKEGSPCIDTATNVGLTADFAGTSVPLGRGPDVGAFEYDASYVPTPLSRPNQLRIINK